MNKELFAATVRSKKAMVVLASVMSFAGGAAAGTAFSVKRLKSKYEEIAEREIAEAKKFYSVLNDKPSPVELAESYENTDPTLDDAVEALREYAGEENPKDVETPPVAVVNNIFVDNTPEEANILTDEELAARESDAPYILTHDEFFQGEKDYVQNTLTYFEEDDVLVDERDQPIPESDLAVGDENLRRFGHGSKDNNIVYIRNDRMEVDFEVVKSNGSYTRDVIGFKHSDRPGSRKERRFRGDDG